MTQISDHECGLRKGERWAITWLAEMAKEMKDPHAEQVLNMASFSMGVDAKKRREDRKLRADDGSQEAKSATVETEFDPRNPNVPKPFLVPN